MYSIQDRSLELAVDPHGIFSRQELSDKIFQTVLFFNLDEILQIIIQFHPSLEILDPGQDLMPHLVGFHIQKRH